MAGASVAPSRAHTGTNARGNPVTVEGVAAANSALRASYGVRRAQSAAFSSDTVRDLPY